MPGSGMSRHRHFSLAHSASCSIRLLELDPQQQQQVHPQPIHEVPVVRGRVESALAQGRPVQLANDTTNPPKSARERAGHAWRSARKRTNCSDWWPDKTLANATAPRRRTGRPRTACPRASVSIEPAGRIAAPSVRDRPCKRPPAARASSRATLLANKHDSIEVENRREA